MKLTYSYAWDHGEDCHGCVAVFRPPLRRREKSQPGYMPATANNASSVAIFIGGFVDVLPLPTSIVGS